jgi:hypothetical protein
MPAVKSPRPRSEPASESPSEAAPKPVSKLADAEILFQKYFKSVGSRTYAAQVKRAGNGNHFVVLTEGRRDPKTDELRMTRLLAFSEDFSEFFRMMHDLAVFVRENPVPEEVRRRRAAYWKKQQSEAAPAGKA